MDYLMRLSQKSGKREKQKAKIRIDIKNHFSTLLFIYFKLLTLPPKKTNSNCCTADFAVYKRQ